MAEEEEEEKEEEEKEEEEEDRRPRGRGKGRRVVSRSVRCNVACSQEAHRLRMARYALDVDTKNRCGGLMGGWL